MSNTPKIDEILTRLDEYNLNADASSNIKFSVDEIYAHSPDLAHAKDQLYQLILEVIGEDERIDIQSEFDKIDVPHLETDKYPNLDGVRQASRNILKAHQRQKLNNLFEGELDER